MCTGDLHLTSWILSALDFPRLFFIFAIYLHFRLCPAPPQDSRHRPNSALPEEVIFISWFSATCAYSYLILICWTSPYSLLAICPAANSKLVLLEGFAEWVMPQKHLLCCCWVPWSALEQLEGQGKCPKPPESLFSPAEFFEGGVHFNWRTEKDLTYFSKVSPIKKKYISFLN